MKVSLFVKLAGCLAILSLPRFSLSLGKTDTITWGGDSSRAGYETTHNLDPQTVASADFGNIWTAKLPGNFNGIGAEQVLSQPLVYTTGDGVQYVFVATTQNNLYKINAKTGDIVKTRNIGVPFLAADLGGCNDIFPAIGVSGTGVIDPATGLWYLTSKTYSDQFQTGNFGPLTSPGRQNGRYYFHAISTEDLSEAPNFPTLVHQTPFRNNKNRWLVAGDQHQRPALLQVGDYVYTGWASHCIQYNYTGAIIGFHRTTGAIVESFAMQGGLEPNTVAGGGVWMSGGGLSYDGAGSIFFSTGNGYASQLPATGHPVSGRNVPTALEEAVVHMNLNSDGTMSPVDFFMPWEKTQLDGADKDLGTTPFQLLPSAFSCPNDRRVGVITGKSGKTYWLNADNLGGYQQGANRLDDAIFVYQHENSVYSAVGVMPIGKYIYVNVINYKTRVFQWSCTANGDGAITEITTAADKNAQPIGVGHGTTTSVDGREGTGLYWTTDVEGFKLRVYDATPPSDGSPLKLIRGFNYQNPGKFAHPVFGDGKAYVGAQGALYAFGSPVNLPLNCTGPVTFAKTSVNGTSDPLPVTCTANVATAVTSINISGNPNFAIVAGSLPKFPLTLAAGQQFSFQARFAPTAVGPLSSDVIITTSNQAAGSSSRTPVTLSGTANSVSGLFGIQPITVSFNTTIGAGEVQKSVFFNNDGDTAVTIKTIQFSTVSETGPWVEPVTTDDGKKQVAQFTFTNLPSTIPANTRQAVGISYVPPSAGNHAVFVKVSTDGGSKILDVFGATGSAPSALFEFQRPDGSGWDQYVPGKNFSFGNVYPGQVLNLIMRITNNGSNTASPLGLTVSKPPFGVTGFVKAANSIDLAEGTQIAAGQSANATVFCAPPERQVNTPSTQAAAPWRINTNSDQGAVILNFDCTAAAPQVGPLLSNGSAQHGYIGCYQDQTPGRQLSYMAYADDNNTAGKCINACAASGYNFTGMVFRRECWCGNALPLKRGSLDDCNYRCTGDDNHTCGGNGVAQNLAMIDVFADSSKWDGVLQGPDLAITQTSGAYSYAGCYAESGGKTFNTKTTGSALNTVDNCRTFCGTSQLFGLQYGAECYCGATIASTSTLVDDAQCGMTCKGNNSQFCGGPSRMQVYRLGVTSSTSSLGSSSTSLSSSSATGTTIASSVSPSSTASSVPTPEPEADGVSVRIGSFRYQGCYNEVPGRALTTSSKNDVGMTNRICAAFCAGSAYFATEYATECYCGNTLNANSLPVTDGRCSVQCKGNSTEMCGGANGLTLFKLDVSSSSSSSLSATANPTSSSTSSTTSGGSLTPSSNSASSGTSTLTSSSTTAVNTPVSTPLKCPVDDGTTWVSNSQTFLIECGKDYAGNDMRFVGVDVNNLNQCINACATTTGCRSVALSGGACYLKSGVGKPVSNGVWGARVVAVTSMTTSSSTSISSSTPSGFLTSTILSTSSSGTGASSSISMYSTSLSSSSQSSASSTAMSSTSLSVSSPSSSAAVTGSGSAVSFSSTTSSSSLSVSSQSSSAAVTDSGSAISSSGTLSSSSLVSISIVSTATSALTSGSSSAPISTSTLISTSASTVASASSSSSTTSSDTPVSTSSSAVASSPIFTGSSSSSSSSVTIVPTTSTSISTSLSTSTSSTPTGPTVAATAGIYYSLGCYSEKSGGRALTEVYTNKSMTVEMCASEAQRLQYDFMGLQYGQECWMGDSFNTTTSPSLAQSKCNTACPGNKAVTCGSGNTLQMYMLNSTLATPKTEAPAGVALSCPASDDQAWTASNGSKFRIECGWDRNGGASDRVTTATYEGCLEACAKKAGCGSVALSGQDCYLKTGTLGTRVRKDSIRGATLILR